MRIVTALLVAVVSLAGIVSAQCGPGVTPYTEDFETGVVGVPGTYPTGWVDAGGVLRWNVHSGSTPTAETGPMADAIGGANYIFIETSAPAVQGDDALVETPCYDASGLTSPAMEFWYHIWGATSDTLEVLQDDGTGTFSVIWSTSFTQGTLWHFASVPVMVPQGQTTTRFQFRAVCGAGETGDIALDAITFGEASAPLPEFQVNNPVSSLDIDGVQVTSPFGPAAVIIGQTNSIYNLNVNTSVPGNFGDLAVSTFPVVAASVGGAWYPGSNVINLDVNQPIISFNGGGTDLFLASMNPTSMPLSSPTPVCRSGQLVMVDPAAVDGFSMSQAVQLDIIDLVPVSLSDDSFQTMPLGFSFSFYGVGYTEVHVGSNGQVTFGIGSPGWSFDPTSFHGNEPTIAELASDLDPSSGGTVGFGTDNVSTFEVLFTNVPPCCGSTTPNSTFHTTAINGTSISLEYGNTDQPYDTVVGLSPGGSLGVLLPLDLSTSSGTTFTAPGTDVPYEHFPWGGGSTIVDLAGLTITFTLDASGNPTGIL